MPRMKTCLWFDGQAQEAAEFYTGLFPDARIEAINRSPCDYPAGKEGDVLTVEFSMFGQSFFALNGGPEFRFDEAISFEIETQDQQKTDHYWAKLTENGGSESVCGWCKDRFGLSWQVTPRQLTDAIASDDKAAAKRAMEAMMQMVKIDIAAIERAFRGETA